MTRVGDLVNGIITNKKKEEDRQTERAQCSARCSENSVITGGWELNDRCGFGCGQIM